MTILKDKLYPFQREIYYNEIDNDSHALFMEVGTGKGITSLALAESKGYKKILIVCLVAKREEWKEEVSDRLGRDLTILDKGTKKNLDLMDDHVDGLIINFESVWRLGDKLLDLVDDTWIIIVDESHMIKNRKAKVTKFMYQLGRKTPYKMALTGTPQSQGYIDYYSQMIFLGKWKMGVGEFEKRYCVMGRMYLGKSYIQVIKDYKNKDELDDMINQDSVFYRRTLADDMIPQDNYVKVKTHITYNRFKKDKVLETKDDIYLGDTIGAYRMGLRQLSSGFMRDYRAPQQHKVQWVDDFFKTYDGRVVIFYNFNHERDMLIELCEKHKRPHSEYSGRLKDLTKFKHEDNGVAICNYASASTGINDLVLSEIAIFYSPVEDVIQFQQSRGRLNRIGQQRKPLFYYLEAENTVESAIYKSLKEGKDFDDKLFQLYLDNE